MKIFLGTKETSGYFHGLQQGFLKLGYDCLFISKSEHVFKYQVEKRLYVKLLQYVNKQAGKWSFKEKPVAKIFWHSISELLMLPVFVYAIFSYDIFIFISGSSFLRNNIDLPILKLFRKKVIFLYVGSDARPPYIDGSSMAIDSGRDIKECIKLTKRIRKKIKWSERFADYIIAHPGYAHFFSKEIILGLCMGIPRELSINEQRCIAKPDGMIKIVHSPSHPEAKGTPIIRSVIASLQRKGYNIEFIEITGQPNSVVLDYLAKCDFVVDQLYSDTPLASFANEAALFAKPAVVGGYYADYIRNDFPEDEIPPSEFVHPDRIEQAIERLIVDEKYRLELGLRAKVFADFHQKPERVAQRFLCLINDSIPPEWIYEPNQINYFFGSGLSENRMKELIHAVVEVGGTEALQLDHNVSLKNKLLELVGLGTND